MCGYGSGAMLAPPRAGKHRSTPLQSDLTGTHQPGGVETARLVCYALVIRDAMRREPYWLTLATG